MQRPFPHRRIGLWPSLQMCRPAVSRLTINCAVVGAVHFLWLGAFCAASPPFEGVGPAHVFEAASDGGQGVGSCLRPAAPGSFEPVPDDAIAGAFRDAGSDRQAASGRGRSAFGPCRPRRCGCRQRRLRTGRRRGFRFPCPASGCFPILSIHAFRLPRPPTARCRCGRRPRSRSCLPRLPGLRVPAVGRALDTPESRHAPLIERPSRKWVLRISPILSAPSIPRPALPHRRRSSRTHHRTGADLEFRPCPKGAQSHADTQSAARGGLRGICGRPGTSDRLPPGSLGSRIFSRTQLGSTPPRRRDGAASAGELGPDSRRHPIIPVKGLP